MKTPVINVNLSTCSCASSTFGSVAIVRRASGIHEPLCPGTPVLIPCHIQRSVVMEVRLGECDCAPRRDLLPGGGVHLDHSPSCLTHTIRVACDIGGETWEASEVVDVEIRPRETLAMVSTHDMQRILAACRKRWALVKALVTGRGARDWAWDKVVGDGETAKRVDALFTQRDTVFAALAEMARAEEVLRSRVRDLAGSGLNDVQLTDVRMRTAGGAAEAGLSAYVEHLIEQAGVL